MKALVTGASGYIGQRLCEKLRENGREVWALVRRESSAEELKKRGVHTLMEDHEMTLQSFFQEHSISTIFHLAGEFSPEENPSDILKLQESNFSLGLRLFMASSQCSRPPRWIQTGTYWQYGESGEFQSKNLYGALKTSFQSLIASYQNKRPSMSLILYDVYGGQDTRPKLIPTILKKTLESDHEDPSFSMTPGEQMISFIHRDDVVRAYLKAEEFLHESPSSEHKSFFIYERSQSLRDWIDEMISYLPPSQLQINWGERPYPEYQIMRPYFGNRLPGWDPQVSFKQGIKDMIDE